MKNSSNPLTQAALTYLNTNGYRAWRQNNGGVYDPKLRRFRKSNGRLGVSDILGIQLKTGRFVAVEIKTINDTLSPEQIQFLKDVAQAGGIAIAAYTLDQFLEKIKPFNLK